MCAHVQTLDKDSAKRTIKINYGAHVALFITVVTLQHTNTLIALTYNSTVL